MYNFQVNILLYDEAFFNRAELLFVDRFDHSPDEDHNDSITGLTSCPRLKLYASGGMDGTIRIWNDENQLIRLVISL